ncbi:MAG: sigma-70 family RNA polymerase sigma factor [Endomicrobiia bacterium]
MKNDLKNNKFDKKFFGLVYAIASKYKNNFIDFDDILQEGFLGLYKAWKKFDSSKGILFSTYAAYWIKKQILQYINMNKKQNLICFDEVEPHKLSYQESYFIENEDSTVNFEQEDFSDLEKKILDLTFNKKITLKLIAEKTNLTTERVRQILSRALRKIKINKKLTENLLKVNL